MSKPKLTPYQRPHRIRTLSADQELAADKLALDVVGTMQLILDDRIEEDTTLKHLLNEECTDELLLARERILLAIKKEINKAKSI